MRKPEIIWIMHTSPNPPPFSFLTHVFCRNLFFYRFTFPCSNSSCGLLWCLVFPSLSSLPFLPFNPFIPCLQSCTLHFLLSSSSVLLCPSLRLLSSLLVLRFHRSCKNLCWSALKLKHVRIISSTVVHSTGALLLSHLIRRAFKITVFKRISEDSFGPVEHSLVFSHSDNTSW